MREIRHSLKEYGPAVGKWWWIIVVTVALEAIGTWIFFLAEGMKMFPAWLLVAIPLVGLIVAQFFAYHDVRMERDKIKTERDELKKVKNYEKAIDTLSAYFDEGNNNIFNRPIADKVEYGKWQKDWERWETKIIAHLQSEFSLSECYLFKNNVMMPQVTIKNPVAEDQERKLSVVHNQLTTIREIIVRHSDRVQKWRTENT